MAFKVIWVPVHVDENDGGPCVHEFLGPYKAISVIDYEVTQDEGVPIRQPKPCWFKKPVKWARFERKPIVRTRTITEEIG